MWAAVAFTLIVMTLSVSSAPGNTPSNDRDISSSLPVISDDDINAVFESPLLDQVQNRLHSSHHTLSHQTSHPPNDYIKPQKEPAATPHLLHGPSRHPPRRLPQGIPQTPLLEHYPSRHPHRHVSDSPPSKQTSTEIQSNSKF